MTDTAHLQRLEHKIDKLERLIKSQQQAKSAGTWAGPSWITEITGWDKERLRQAREQSIIQFRRSKGGGWEYKIDSLHPLLIKSAPHDNSANTSRSDGSNQAI